MSWFEVDKDGLKQLQAGKPKHYLVRELVQNAWDEKVKIVKLELHFENGIANISISDDSKEGFKDLKDSYTLFKETYKRKDPEKRGRFNLGEKQAFSICEEVELITTKGSIVFNKDGRFESNSKINSGSLIKVCVKMTKEEYEEILETIKLYIVPQKIKFYINGEQFKYVEPFKTFESKLTTELSENSIMRKVDRITNVELYEVDSTYLYEMGIPVTKIDCKYSINVLQKIPLNTDRETVSLSYLKDLFSEVLNNTYDTIEEDNSSQSWIKEAMSDERINKEAVETILRKRYGDKVCVADPFDRNSIDEAISNGYHVIRGSELSKEEWNNVRRFEVMESSSSLFGTNLVNSESVEPNEQQLLVSEYAKKIADRILNISINVQFINDRGVVAAQFGSNTLTFNIAKLGKEFFRIPVTSQTTNLIVHELGHYAGNHTESSYHELITKMTGDLVMLALKEPEFFEI